MEDLGESSCKNRNRRSVRARVEISKVQKRKIDEKGAARSDKTVIFLLKLKFNNLFSEKEKWFRKRETENSVENLAKRSSSINQLFEELEKNFDHPSSFTAEKFQKVANSILEQKVPSYHLENS